MFEKEEPRVFGLPPGVDFGTEFVRGLRTRMGDAPPEAWARVRLLTNAGRMARRLKACLSAEKAALLPRIGLVTDLDAWAGYPDVPEAVSGVTLTLELAELIRELIDRQPGVAPRSAAFDLAATLARLLDEIGGEQVSASRISDLDVGEHAAHWARAKAVVEAANAHFSSASGRLPGAEARRAALVESLGEQWAERPPEAPVIVVGSTASRGTTRALMEAVARLPQGALVLPGFDFELPDHVWESLRSPMISEDHPQYRFKRLLEDLELKPTDVQRWTDTGAPSPERNRLVSLALRPAPVTDAWMEEGPALDGLGLSQVDLIEAPDLRREARAIALCMREAAEREETVTLITPDRDLSRQVTAMLGHWQIIPDDSAGIPLIETPAGRLTAHVAETLSGERSVTLLLALLKHPLTATGGDGAGRGQHTLLVRSLEIDLRRKALQRVTGSDITDWASQRTEERAAWAQWLCGLWDRNAPKEETAEGWARVHAEWASDWARGPSDPSGAGRLWTDQDGSKLRECMDKLVGLGGAGGPFPARDYVRLLLLQLQDFPLQQPERAHPRIRIRGTLEARVQDSTMVILGGLNEGSWPSMPGPDPWLNRSMRQALGLLLPERQIGLSAHDFQQAVAAPRVVLSRSLRSADAETVPARWLNRLVNLLDGIGDEGEAALENMRSRGAVWISQVAALETPPKAADPATRPSPKPPVTQRPVTLSVTDVGRLIRNPYEIYARKILGLKSLPVPGQRPDARLRGIALHSVMEAFLKAGEQWHGDVAKAAEALRACADQEFARTIPDPSLRALWRARFDLLAPQLAEAEVARRRAGRPVLLEDRGERSFAAVKMSINARPDRIDLLETGAYAIFDYKSGKPPSEKQVDSFDKQLLLEAAILRAGGFGGVPPGEVDALTYLTLNPSEKDLSLKLETSDGEDRIGLTWERLERLVGLYSQATTGYTARRAMKSVTEESDYDRLSRFGEWSESDPAASEDVGE